MKTIIRILIITSILLLTSCSVSNKMRKLHAPLGDGSSNKNEVFSNVIKESGGSNDIEETRDVVEGQINAIEVGSSAPEYSNSHIPKPKPVRTNRRPSSIESNSPQSEEDANQYEMGYMNSSIPDTMWYGSTNLVELRITRDLQTPGFVITDRKSTTTEIRVSSHMSALIYDVDDAFEVRSINSEAVQVIESGKEYTSWQWVVVPKKKGVHELIIKVKIIKGEDKKEIEVGQNKVLIKIKTGDSVMSFFDSISWTKFTWLMGTIIIPLIGFLYNRKKKKSKK